jgi:MFS transporter, SHS family, lactate transporter
MLAMESWPARSRGLMGGILQSAYNVGYLAALVVYSLLADKIGWRGVLFLGILPALLVLWIRGNVMESDVWITARARRPGSAAVGAPSSIFGRTSLGNILTTCWWTVSMAIVNLSISVFFASHLVVDVHLTSSSVGALFVGYNIATLLGCGFWGALGDRIGRRGSMLIPAGIGIVLTPIYLLATDLSIIEAGFVAQGFFAGAAVICQLPAWLAERFPTGSRAFASGLCYHLGLVVAATAVPMAIGAAVSSGAAAGFTTPMLVGTIGGLISFILAVLAGPETKGRDLTADP